MNQVVRICVSRTTLKMSSSCLRPIASSIVANPAVTRSAFFVKISPAASVKSYSTTTGNVFEVSINKVRESSNDSLTTLIDVRQPQELKDTGSIPGSINIPLNLLNEALDLPDDKFEELYAHPKPAANDDIVFYCMAGIRSANAVALAVTKGFGRAKHYPGGWKEWAEESAKGSQ